MFELTVTLTLSRVERSGKLASKVIIHHIAYHIGSSLGTKMLDSFF